MKVVVSGMAHDGRAIAKMEDKVIFFSGALPQEEVEISLEGKEKKIYLAKVESILKRHQERIQPRCKVFAQCGGCAFQMASEKLEKALKEEVLENALRRIGKIEAEISPLKTMENPWRYRNKGVFHVSYQGGRAEIGFFASKSHDLVPARECLLFSEKVNALVAFIEEKLTYFGLANHIQKLVIRESYHTGEIMLVFVGNEGKFKGGKVVEAILEAFSEVTSIYYNINTNTKLIFGKAFKHLYGKERLEDKVMGKTFLLSPEAFFQINSRQTEVLYQTIKRLLPEGTTKIYDLYSGIGSIGIAISDETIEVIGVEKNHQAVQDAKLNVKQNGLTKAKYLQASAEKWIQKENLDKTATIIIDPPRKGVDKTLLETLVKSDVQNLIYTSCDPATLARDLAYLTKEGYQIKTIQPVDMFPQTAHVETVALLSKLYVDKHIDVEIKLDELDLTSAESKATYAQIKEYILEKFNLKVSTLYIAQIKKKCGIELREHYNKSKKEKQVIPQCTPEKEEAIMDALRHFKMI